MPKQLTQKQLAVVRRDYLSKREDLLISKVDGLSVKLFDKVFEGYLSALEQSEGKLVLNDRNVNMVKGLGEIYGLFRNHDNIPVIRDWVGDLQNITPLNERYFKNIGTKNVRTVSDKASIVVDKKLGIELNGQPKPGGFVDKFIHDDGVLKRIKKMTNQALTQGKGFQEFRQDMKRYIQGDPKLAQSGGLQQYYRNYAYDTFTKVDRLNQDLFAKELGLRYFYWSGGVIKTTRPLCEHCNGKIVDSLQFRDLKFEDLKDKYTPGLDDTWVPMEDLGQYACRHIKDFIPDEVALRNRAKWLDIYSILK